ncbi:SRPBCC family protein [Stenotrophomonas sp. PFBMAA-4]|uniref:SRPBCC family protein n=1 Tax=Stenotrophomonas sp. PFBMAA-4 TaxID=3043301 RepID=UPI0024B5A6D1|nr:SRPBCC family protein [Stenotrophomonas sp. PFBMAA-4]MDI9274208.1 SRPBCC family protein [Stenotrophomonas sp. PFBMAA-4]
MATASASLTVPASADRVWNLIGGFDSLPDWLPYIPTSTLSEGGRVRHLANPDGDAIVERLEAFDQAGRTYTYSILQAPFPVTGYRSTLRVVELDHGARIDWSGAFTPVGVSDEAASALFEGIYRDGLRALQATLAG